MSETIGTFGLSCDNKFDDDYDDGDDDDDVGHDDDDDGADDLMQL